MSIPAHAVPGQSVSPPPHLLTPRIGAVPLQHPLALALDQSLLIGGGPAQRAMGQLGRSEEREPSSQQDEHRPVDGTRAVDFADPSRSPSPALTVSNGPTSPPSTTGSIPPSTSSLSPNPATMSTTSLPLSGAPVAVLSPKAELGFGTLPSEEELKRALSAKDRMFVLMLGKEFEAFIGRVSRGEYTTKVAPSHASASISSQVLDSLGPSKRIDVTATSKYQRMLTYKLAEWYGMRATPGVDAGSMVVGVLGTLDPRSVNLKVSNLVPEASAPQAKFRIMRREAPGTDEDGISRGTSVSGDDGTESSGHRGKTLEERTLAYALARKRIIGDDDLRDDDSASAVSAPHSSSQPRSRQASRYGDDDDEVDPVPRRYPSEYDFVYPSLYHPANSGPTAPGGQQFAYGGMQGGSYQGYPQAMGYDNQQGFMGYPNAQQYAQMGAGYPQWPQSMGQGVPQQQAMAPGMTPMPVMPNQGWYPPEMGMAQPASMMPMIPQGMPYTPNFGYQQQQHQLHPTLVQPTPIRPGLDPLSSTSSSISSRSYQDVHSRPHSRGSTTSTRSAASSVRLGTMYPAGQQAGYGFRQKAVKSQGSFSAARPPPPEPRRNGRQSPASTASSRSSRRASSIHIQPPLPGQHPLPQRPDWAANNVPYHPSPGVTVEPSTSDFPPLLRGAAVTNAEPMQIEKVKMVPPTNGTVWNGGGARNITPMEGPPSLITPQQSPSAPVLSHESVSILPNPMKAAEPPQRAPSPPPISAYEVDPDFPRRVPSTRAPLLYDPGAPVSMTTLRQQRQPAPSPSASTRPSAPLSPPVTSTASDTEDVEHKLADMTIGPRQPPSYAKIVKRD